MQRATKPRGGWGAAARFSARLERAIFGWMVLTIIAMVWDQISLLPPPPPTKVEIAAATPHARAEWARVEAMLEKRIAQPRPMEFGMVWATHTGRTCGLVDHRDTGIDAMKPFFTLGDGRGVFLREDGDKLFMQNWIYCIGDYRVVLHQGSQEAGFCATRRAKHVPIAAILCNGDAAKPFRPDPAGTD